MPDDGPKFIDGFSSIQAVRRIQPATPQDPGRIASRAGHTAVPLRHDIVCYSCLYAFTLTGQLSKVICPKCRTFLNTDDVTVDREWTETIPTIGAVHITESGRLLGIQLVARDIILQGNAEDGSIQATRRLELYPGARFNPAQTRFRDLLVHPGVDLNFERKVACRDIDLGGTLKGTLYSEGVIHLRAGSIFEGELHAPHLIIDDGATVFADLVIGIKAVDLGRLPKPPRLPEPPPPPAGESPPPQPTLP